MQSLPLLSFASLSLVLLITVFRRYWKLRHIPGPLLASSTDLWSAVKTWRGEHYHEFITELHDQYGPVVRWGPNRVSFADPAAISPIYGTRIVHPKAPSYSPLIVQSNGQEIPTLITIRDEKRVSEIKKHVLAGFSTTTWLQQESQIDEPLTKLLHVLKGKTDQEVRLDEWLRYWSFDTLTLLAFSESRAYLDHGADIDGVFLAGKARFSHWRLWNSLPSLEKFIFKNWIAEKLQISNSALARLAMKQIETRQATENQAIGYDLLGRYLAASQQAPEVITARDVLTLTISTISAGFDATAFISASILADALTHPDVFRRLEVEILSAELSLPASFNDIDKLPYLDAVVKESMRLAINPHVNERTISIEDTNICGTFIPAGTDVSVSKIAVSGDQNLFGSNSASFVPERWLDVEETQWRDMDRAQFGFGYGRRVCIGQHLARIQLKKVVANLIRAFQMSLADQPSRGVESSTGFVELKVRLTARS